MNSLLVLLVAALLAACGGSPPEDTDQSSNDARPTSLKDVPRNRTLILDCAEMGICAGQIKDYNTFNPFLPGTTSRTGYNFLYEPLYYYNAFRQQDNLIPWMALGHEFNDDYTQVTVRLRPDGRWSDGTPWTAHDLVSTIDLLKNNAPILTYSTDIATWVAQAEALDDYTARITLTAPNPRFLFTYFTYNFGIGITIVPKHIWAGQDPETFANFDPAKGWPVVSGPYRMVLSTPQQRIWDRRDDWWAAQSGFKALPQVLAFRLNESRSFSVAGRFAPIRKVCVSCFGGLSPGLGALKPPFSRRDSVEPAFEGVL